jgi:hypothetical protein
VGAQAGLLCRTVWSNGGDFEPSARGRLSLERETKAFVGSCAFLVPRLLNLAALLSLVARLFGLLTRLFRAPLLRFGRSRWIGWLLIRRLILSDKPTPRSHRECRDGAECQTNSKVTHSLHLRPSLFLKNRGFGRRVCKAIVSPTTLQPLELPVRQPH